MGNKDVPESNIQSQPKSNAADSGKSSVDFVYRRPANIIDDFIAPASPRPHPATPSSPMTAEEESFSNRHTAGYQHHDPEHSQTLMRNAVNRPTHQPLSFRRVRTPAGTLPPRPTMDIPIDDVRMHHLDTAVNVDEIPKSAMVNRYAAEDDFVPQPAAKAEQPKLEPAAAAAPAAMPADTVSSHQVVNEGYRRAKSHEQTYQPQAKRAKRSKRRFVKSLLTTAIVAVILAGLASGGWFVYQKSAVIDARFASWRAGFTIEVPAYSPSGFIFKAPISYGKSEASLSYRAIASDQSYKVKEQVSRWDSQTLLTNIITNNNLSYQTFQAGGLYIYIYGNRSATWVSGNVWYTISGNENLSAKSLAEIAAST
ncbi:MAG TPA: hypothetical protein VMR08_00215 [Patescibacteria group bacterium]|nr:hypothetical protein [Patescibacteria group bacterium]